jgi:hypothetical protein
VVPDVVAGVAELVLAPRLLSSPVAVEDEVDVEVEAALEADVEVELDAVPAVELDPVPVPVRVGSVVAPSTPVGGVVPPVAPIGGALPLLRAVPCAPPRLSIVAGGMSESAALAARFDAADPAWLRDARLARG